MENNTERYIQEIREIDGLKNAVLTEIVLSKKDGSAEFSLITNTAYSAQAEAAAQMVSQRYLPAGFSAKMRIIKRVPDADGVQRRIYEFIHKRFPVAAAYLSFDDVYVEITENGANFRLDISEESGAFFSADEVLDETSKYLSSGYCGAFFGQVRLVKGKEEEIDLDAPIDAPDEVVYTPETRRFPICGFAKLDGVDTIPKQAVYIADSGNMTEGYSVCGTLTFIEEKEYVKHNEKTGADETKSRFSLSINDGSGSLRTTYFPKKNTVDKVRELKAGDKIVITGLNEVYNDRSSFKANKINYGEPPADFVPVAKKGKPVPTQYKTVFPTPYVDYSQGNLFSVIRKPEVLKGTTFVVFDLETTGLNSQPSMGKMDKIIEVGAAKLVDGEIVETFSSLVSCSDKLSPRITELTGIKDEDLIGKPPIEDVIADFYKFVDGACLIGHNVAFDYGFIRYYGEQHEYVFGEKRLDTVAIAHEVLKGRVNNFKLNTLADYYGFDFNHHRAYEDAVTTAKIFIELITERGRLP